MMPPVPKSLQFFFVFILVFGPLAFGCVEPWSLAILQGAIFLLFFLCFSLRIPFYSSPLYKTFFPAVMVLMLVGVLQRFHPNPLSHPHSFLPFTAFSYGTSQALLLWGSYVAWLFCVPQLLRGQERLRQFAWLLFLLGVFIAVVGIMQMGQGNKAIYGLREVYQRDPFGPYYNRGHAASMMVMSVLTGCGLFFSRFFAFRSGRIRGRLPDLLATQMLLLFMISIIAYGIYKTGSRGGMHSFIFSIWLTSLLAVGFLKDRTKVWTIQLALGLIPALYAAFLYFSPYWIGYARNSLDISAVYRLSMYRSGLSMIGDFPIWGVGLGAFRVVFPAYQEPMVKGIVEHVHSDWLELFLETGVIGLLVYTLGLLGLFFHAYKAWRKYPSRELRCLTGGLLAAALAFLFHGLVEFSFQIPANAVLFFAIITALVSPALGTGEGFLVQTKTNLISQPPRFISIGVCMLSLGLLALAARPAVAWWHAGRSTTLSERPYYLAKAVRWDPNPKYFHRTAQTYLALADTASSARRIFLRQALQYSSQAVQAEPQNSRFKRFQSLLLWHLDRQQDAQGLLKEAQRVYFKPDP